MNFDDINSKKDFVFSNDLFGEIFNTFYCELLKYVLVITNNLEDSQDIVQNLFVKLPESIKKYNPKRGGFKSWLFACVRNEALNFINKEKRIEGNLLKLSNMIIETVDDISIDVYLLNDLIDILNGREMEYFFLKFYSNLTDEEISRSMKLSKTTLKRTKVSISQKIEKYNKGGNTL